VKCGAKPYFPRILLGFTHYGMGNQFSSFYFTHSAEYKKSRILSRCSMDRNGTEILNFLVKISNRYANEVSNGP